MLTNQESAFIQFWMRLYRKRVRWFWLDFSSGIRLGSVSFLNKAGTMDALPPSSQNIIHHNPDSCVFVSLWWLVIQLFILGWLIHWKLLILLDVAQSYTKWYYFIRFSYQTNNLIIHFMWCFHYFPQLAKKRYSYIKKSV